MKEVIKLSKKELDTLKQYQRKNDLIVLRLGRTDVQKAILEGQRGVILEDLSKLQEETKVTAKTLQEKYGDGNVNLETGEFTLVK